MAVERVPYDEMSMFHENAEEFGLPYDGPPTVRRESVEVEPGRRLSALVWGDGDPELVLLHGGGQNAHTWDTVAMALGRPLVALDLTGHGHSDGGRQGSVDVTENAKDVAVAIRALAPNAAAVVGMSLGGIRSEVRESFRGTSACTHLNDALRSVGDVGALLDALRA
jgi:pimeloyl-ACP methyl ester carboxylesterase